MLPRIAYIPIACCFVRECIRFSVGPRWVQSSVKPFERCGTGTKFTFDAPLMSELTAAASSIHGNIIRAMNFITYVSQVPNLVIIRTELYSFWTRGSLSFWYCSKIEVIAVSVVGVPA